MTHDLPDLGTIRGMTLATRASGTGYAARDDMLLCAFEADTVAAGTLTRSSTPAAPVRWTRERLAAGDAPRALVVNAGNANCFTGKRAFALVEGSVAALAGSFDIAPESVYVCSTGRIGEPIAEDAYMASLAELRDALAPPDFAAAARAIMTTDAWPKARAVELGSGARLVGITKGATMIAPNMATTLTFLFTDAAVDAASLQAALSPAVGASYNCVTVDNTTSTNDSLLCFATGKAGPVAPERLSDALHEVLGELSRELVEDGRRAGKVLAIRVSGATTTESARAIARAVANSLLVRLCLSERPPYTNAPFSAGRVMAAIGAAVQPVSADDIEIRLAGVPILSEGAVVNPMPEAALAAIDGNEIALDIDVAHGRAEGRIWTALVA